MIIISFMALTMVVSNKLFEVSKNNIFNLAQEITDSYKNKIRVEPQSARVTSKILASAFESLKDSNLNERKKNNILKRTLAKKEYISPFYITYEPNALNEKDKNFVGEKPEYDKTNYYSPY
ncbi:MAG: hypothetical protein AMR96_04800 [Candidatus Adiutrix intracellularis]|nr:MAG: hypothetical protein AMR96_04800 [Candidatus Adiutrix intracellularis]